MVRITVLECVPGVQSCALPIYRLRVGLLQEHARSGRDGSPPALGGTRLLRWCRSVVARPGSAEAPATTLPGRVPGSAVVARPSDAGMEGDHRAVHDRAAAPVFMAEATGGAPRRTGRPAWRSARPLRSRILRRPAAAYRDRPCAGGRTRPDRAGRADLGARRLGAGTDTEPTDGAAPEIGRSHVCTPVTNAHLVCRLMLEQKQNNSRLH